MKTYTSVYGSNLTEKQVNVLRHDYAAYQNKIARQFRIKTVSDYGAINPVSLFSICNRCGHFIKFQETLSDTAGNYGSRNLIIKCQCGTIHHWN